MLAVAGVFQKLLCIACRMQHTGDQAVRMVERIAICPDDGNFAGHRLHTRWIVCAIETSRKLDRPFCGVVGQQKKQQDTGVSLFGGDYGFRGKAVEPAVMTDDKFCYPERQNVPFYFRLQCRTDFCGHVPVACKKTCFPAHYTITNPFELY